MSDSAHDAFLRAIREDPDNDVPRLIYADWLDEQGDPRGEFIRVQCELAGLTEEDPQYDSLKKREEALLRRHKADWTGAVRPLVKQFTLRRGFVEEVVLTDRQFRRSGAALWGMAPIRRVIFWNLADAQVSRLARDIEWPAGSGVSINYKFSERPGGGLIQFLESPHVQRLGRLGMSGDRLSPEHIRACSRLTSLKSLGLRSQSRPDRPLKEALGAIGALVELERLDLSYVGITRDGLQALVEGGPMPRLKDLLLAHNRIGTKGMDALTEGEPFPALTALDLRCNQIGSAGTVALASAPWIARQVRRLDLGENFQLKGRGGRAIAESLRPSTLLLNFCSIGLTGARALARSPNMEGLRVLNLSANDLDDRAAGLILESPYLENLVSLDLTANGLSRKMQTALRKRFGPDVCRFSQPIG
jgi:uncharacterized protein (TIGR02996 family)